MCDNDKNKDMVTEKIIKKDGNVHNEGKGKIDPVEIKRAIFETAKDLKHADKDIEKMEHDREELLADLAELRSYDKGEKEGGVSGANGKLIERSIRAIQKRIQKMSGALPDLGLAGTQKKIHAIITEWKEGKNDLRAAKIARTHAEHRLAKNPTDSKALGNANRAEAIIYDANLKLDKIAQEAILAESNMTPNPVADESVNIHTGETENEKLKTKDEKMEETPIQNAVREKEIHYTREQVLADQRERASILAEHDPVHDEWIHYTHEQALADGKILEATHTIPAENIIVSTLSELVQKEIPPQEMYEDHIPREHPVTEIQEKIIKPEEAEAHRAELPAPETHLLLEDSEAFAEDYKETEKKKTPLSPPSYADRILGDHLNKLFGRKGFLGFGAKEGVVSPHWMDPVVGFALKTVDEVREASAQTFTDEEVFIGAGIENKQETAKMRDYIAQAIEQTGVAPLVNEKVEEYMKRAIATAVKGK